MWYRRVRHKIPATDKTGQKLATRKAPKYNHIHVLVYEQFQGCLRSKQKSETLFNTTFKGESQFHTFKGVQHQLCGSACFIYVCMHALLPTKALAVWSTSLIPHDL